MAPSDCFAEHCLFAVVIVFLFWSTFLVNISYKGCSSAMYRPNFMVFSGLQPLGGRPAFQPCHRTVEDGFLHFCGQVGALSAIYHYLPVSAGEYGGSTWMIKAGSNRQRVSHFQHLHLSILSRWLGTICTLITSPCGKGMHGRMALLTLMLSLVPCVIVFKSGLRLTLWGLLGYMMLNVSQLRLQTLEKGQTAVAAGAQRAMQLVALQQLASVMNQQ